MNIFCGSLPWSTEEDELRSSFESFGEVASVRIITDKFTGRSKGFGFVEMVKEVNAVFAIKKLNGKTIANSRIRVKEAETK